MTLSTHSLPLLAALLLTALSLPRHTRAGESDERHETQLALAQAYLRAYQDQDMPALAEFWTSESVWQDPTGAEIGASAEPVRGAENIRAHLTAVCAGIKELRFDLPQRFTSGAQVVCIGRFSFVLEARGAGSSADIPFSMDTVIILELKEGKVVRHTDYADFSSWRAQYEAGRR